MGLETILAIVGIVVTVSVPFWIYTRTNPKRRLRYRVETTPLLSVGVSATERLKVLLDDEPVDDPQIVSLSLWSDGRGDIGSDAFDGGRPLTFVLGAPILEELASELKSDPRLEIERPDRIVLRPGLIHRRFQSTIRVVVNGSPTVTHNHVFQGVSVLGLNSTAAATAIESSRRRLRVTPLLVSTGVLVFAVVLLIVSIIIYSVDEAAYLPWGVISVLLVMAALVAIVGISIFRFFRWTARNIEARSGLSSNGR